MIRLLMIRTCRFYIERSNARMRGIEMDVIRADLDTIRSDIWRWRYRVARRFGWGAVRASFRRRPRRWIGELMSPALREIAASMREGRA